MKLSEAFDLVAIRWDDAESGHGWEDTTETAINEALATTVGFLIKQTKTHYLVAATVSPQSSGGFSSNNRLQIPKGMVKEIEIMTPRDTLTAGTPLLKTSRKKPNASAA